MHTGVAPEITTNSENVVLDLIEAISDIENTDPMEMTPPLWEAIDPDSLESLLASTDDSLRVQFEYHNHKIVVHGDGEICVEPGLE